MPEQKEISAILDLPPDKRYAYSVKRIADFASLWAIGDDQGFGTYEDDNKNIIFPLWPFRDFALLCCTGAFKSCQPEELQLEDFFKNYIPDFKNQGYKLSILPLPSDKGAVIDIDLFQHDLKNELDKYESM
jgi:hypothetical protein